MYIQLVGTVMGKECGPPYDCLTAGYLEETKCFTNELPKLLNESECKLIMSY